MYPDVYIEYSEQLSFFDVPEIKPVVCCRKEHIESFGRKRVFEQQRNGESITLIILHQLDIRQLAIE
ncbi:MAG: hypothetical protein HPY74_05620 [Firmicutes bacterium]|nr:hypothetical protein [Bacillota bacterium]